MMHYYLQSKSNPDEIITVFGYWYKEACQRNNINPDEWIIIDSDYVD